MVTTASRDFKCNVCGKHSEQRYIINSSADGDSDLDLRTAEPHRSSMQYWTMTCPECGYCCEDIEKYSEIERDFLESEKYLTLDGIPAISDIAKNFIRKALIKIQTNNIEDALQSYVYASWAFDDENEYENAIECRNRAIELIDEFLKTDKNHNYDVLKCDLLRRAGRFQEVIELYSDKKYSNPAITQLVCFEVLKASDNDNKIYKLGDISNNK